MLHCSAAVTSFSIQAAHEPATGGHPDRRRSSLNALSNGRPWHRLGIVLNAQREAATTRRDVRPKFAQVVFPTLYPCGKVGLKIFESRDYDDMFRAGDSAGKSRRSEI